jgi:hypothetical protein
MVQLEDNSAQVTGFHLCWLGINAWNDEQRNNLSIDCEKFQLMFRYA